jgi:murein DD-endopeptidase MepM/ murein hydrolase activator NlpD
VLAVAALLTGWGINDIAVRMTSIPGFEQAVLGRWLAGLQEDADELDQLRRRFVAESEAQGKLLARMEARLLRMEAFGARLVESAALDGGEFDFSGAPALGGPLSPLDLDRDGTPDPYLDPSMGSQIEVLAERMRKREADLEILERVLASRKLLARQLPSGTPVTRGWISSPFGTRIDPIHGHQAFHAGVDFVGRAGSPVLAAGAGVVTFAGEKSEYGRTVEITHGQGLLTRYAHHSELKAEVGDIVRRGDVIGLMGRTGRATGYHVHFEVEKDGKAINPAGFLKHNRS